METKGQLKSKGMIGAWLSLLGSVVTVAGAMGWLPAGIYFDPATWDLTINLKSVGGLLASGAIGIGGPLAWIGRKWASSAIKGLW